MSSERVSVIPEVVRRINNVISRKAAVLDLSGLGLIEVPDAVFDLTSLTVLDLHNNQLTALPDRVGSLTSLERLYLQNNQLTALPVSLGNLINLVVLNLRDNQLTAVPTSLGDLIAPNALYLNNNQLRTLPDSIGNLVSLTKLDLRSNQLATLPDSIGNLTALTELDLRANKLTMLPEALGGLTELSSLYLDRGGWVSPPPEIVSGGSSSVLTFLRAQRQGAVRQWSSKMLVVGEAAVGKTSVTKALCGLPFDTSEPQTHGVRVKPLDLAHPSDSTVTMRLSVWDFGGQLEYRATQRFYLTDRSLFMLVWNSRRGWRTGGQIEAWLQAIATAAPQSPIVVVATHCLESMADLDDDDIRRRYPQVVHILRVDCVDGTGIPELNRALAAQAARLPLMGQSWPTAWATATDTINARQERYIARTHLESIMKDAGVHNNEDCRVLIAALHDRGEILHFANDPELCDTVILQPTWVDALITKVLDSQEVADRGGLLSRLHREQLWPDLDPGMADRLTAMMERFDLAYRVDSPDHNDIALVVERLRAGAPVQLASAWSTSQSGPPMTQLRVIYKLASRQAGIPSWFIAREHRYTTSMMWSRGVLLRYRGSSSPAMALLQDDDSAQPTITITVRGTEPHTFYSILNEGFTRIISDRYPGLEMRRYIPCPCAAQPCVTEFEYDAAERALSVGQPLQCHESYQMIDPQHLLMGLRSNTAGQLDRIEKHVESLGAAADRSAYAQLLILDTVRDLLRHRDEQGTRCPSIFTITKTGRIGYELRLYCEQPDGPHPLPDGAGTYHLTKFPDWLRHYAPYLRALLLGIKLAAPYFAPAMTAISGIVLPEPDKARLDITIELLDRIGRFPKDTSLARLNRPRSPADFAQLRATLYELDPEWGGLRERELPESGDVAYLCVYHRQALRYPAQAAY